MLVTQKLLLSLRYPYGSHPYEVFLCLTSLWLVRSHRAYHRDTSMIRKAFESWSHNFLGLGSAIGYSSICFTFQWVSSTPHIDQCCQHRFLSCISCSEILFSKWAKSCYCGLGGRKRFQETNWRVCNRNLKSDSGCCSLELGRCFTSSLVISGSVNSCDVAFVGSICAFCSIQIKKTMKNLKEFISSGEGY